MPFPVLLPIDVTFTSSPTSVSLNSTSVSWGRWQAERSCTERVFLRDSSFIMWPGAPGLLWMLHKEEPVWGRKRNHICGEGWPPPSQQHKLLEWGVKCLKLRSSHSFTWNHNPFFLSRYLWVSLSELEFQHGRSPWTSYPFVGWL